MRIIRFGVAILVAALSAAVFTSTNAAAATSRNCNVSYGGVPYRRSFPCTTSDVTTYSSMALLGHVDGGYPLTKNYRGWAKINTAGPCPLNPMMVGGRCSPKQYRYTATGWVMATVPNGVWVYAQPFTGDWYWIYYGGAWYVVNGYDVEGYCAGTAAVSYSNCVFTGFAGA